MINLPNGIPIKSFGRLIEIKKRVLIVVLAWNFSEDIIRKLKQNNVKGEVLIPLPKVELKNMLKNIDKCVVIAPHPDDEHWD